MDPHQSNHKLSRRKRWTLPENAIFSTTCIILFIVLGNCQAVQGQDSNRVDGTIQSSPNKLEGIADSSCHSCQLSSSNSINNDNNETKVPKEKNFLANIINTVSRFSEKYVFTNNTERQLQNVLESFVDSALEKDKYELFEGVEIKSIDSNKTKPKESREDKAVGRALFSTYTYEYRVFQKIKTFIDTHILSINLPKAARLIGLRSFGLKKLFFPLLIGAQIFKSILLAMFLPSILGSFGKILGKGISHISAASSQASYPPANGEEQTAYNNDNKDIIMGYETNPAATYAYSQDEMFENANDVNDLSNIDMSRFGIGGQKVSYLPTKNSYYKNQMSTSNNYKIFQKIPASSMILSNYDPFYSPLLSRLDGIFARLGLVPSDSSTDDGTTIGGQSLSDVKLEACREQLICLMYSSPAKYAPYSNLVSAQLSRELNELRRPVSDNPEILRFFRYMRAARRGQEGDDCIQGHQACAVTTPSHTMIAAYNDINKLVTARKLRN